MKKIKTTIIDDKIEYLIENENQFSRLITLLKNGSDYTVVITTEDSFLNFHSKFGKFLNAKYNSDSLNEVGRMFDPVLFNQMTAQMALGELISETYFLKSIADEKVYEIKGEINA